MKSRRSFWGDVASVYKYASRPDRMLLLRKRNYKIIASTVPIPLIKHKFSVILDTGNETSFFYRTVWCFLKPQVAREAEMAKIYGADDNSLVIVGYLNVQVRWLAKLVTFFVYKWRAAPAILGCNFFAQFVAMVYQRTRLVEVIDESRVFDTRHYWKKQSKTTTV